MCAGGMDSDENGGAGASISSGSWEAGEMRKSEKGAAHDDDYMARGISYRLSSPSTSPLPETAGRHGWMNGRDSSGRLIDQCTKGKTAAFIYMYGVYRVALSLALYLSLRLGLGVYVDMWAESMSKLACLAE